MAQVIPGASGAVTLAGHVQQFFSIEVNTGKALLPVSAFGNEWERYVGGLKRANGTVTFYLSNNAASTNPFDDASDAAMVLTFATGCTFGLNVTVGDLRIVGQVDGVPVATMAWAKSDDADPTIAWDETSGA